MALRWGTTDQISASRGVKFLVHGPAGAGKTTLIQTLPNPLILSAEGGLLSLAGVSLHTIEIGSIAEFDEAYQFCAYSEHMNQFDSVAIDSLSEIAEKCLSAEKQVNKDPRKAYGNTQDLILDRVRWFRDLLGKHVYFSCKQDRIKDDTTGITIYGPKMPGQQMGPALPYLFDEVFSMETAVHEGQEYRFLRTKRGLQYDAKDRSGKLDEFEQPNLTTVIEKILGKVA